MQRLEISEMIRMIESGITFSAEAFDGSFEIKINRYLPYCCTAIHDGSNLRSDLKEKIALDEYNRWYEEDPYTGGFIASMPITLVGKDSRYEYDLNRNPEECVHEIAWEKKVWKNNLTKREKQLSINKHTNYYAVTHALIKKLEELFGGCVVYDIHSYNYQRRDKKVPLFNIGTENLDQKKYSKYISNWQEELAKIELPNIHNDASINDVFYGKGYNLRFITQNFKNTLVLATEVKKIYCNELTGEIYPKIIKDLQHQLKNAILNNANYFSQKMTNWKHDNASKLLDKKIDPSLTIVDKGLFRLIKNFELLSYINPINNNTEEIKFIKNQASSIPKFKYSPIKINPYELKKELSNLPTYAISDISSRHLYESVINSYLDKIDLLSSLNSPKFLYNSLRYFGRPSKKDINNANYLIQLPEIATEPSKVPSLGTDEAIISFKKGLNDYGFDAKIELSKKVISQVMVLNSKKTIQFRPDAKFTRSEINALVAHEIGVHMVTTMNSATQKLKLFSVGFPVNTETQEGLAILSEYLSGNITMKRLKKIALRVIVVDMMCNGANFIECYKFVKQKYIADPNEAFTLITRIFRGGGFTKDYLYLSGFVKILRFWNNDNDLNPLLIGKTSLNFYNVIEEMIEREMVDKPTYLTKSFVKPRVENNSDIYDYILSGLK
jgi:uncharacterized protein (TIGR02421 family)